MTVTVIFGPPRTGKTFNREAFARHYGHHRVEDDWDYHQRNPGGDCLILTNRGEDWVRTKLPQARLVPIAAARRALRLPAKVPATSRGARA